MANGSLRPAARLSSASGEVVAFKPNGHAAHDPTPVEIEIGQAVSAAAVAIALAAGDYQEAGELTLVSKKWAGGMLGHLAELQMAHLGESEFARIAHREGRRALRLRPDLVLLARFDFGSLDATFDFLIGHALAIAQKVARDEMALRAN